jgi:hypothetical protein
MKDYKKSILEDEDKVCGIIGSAKGVYVKGQYRKEYKILSKILENGFIENLYCGYYIKEVMNTLAYDSGYNNSETYKRVVGILEHIESSIDDNIASYIEDIERLSKIAFDMHNKRLYSIEGKILDSIVHYIGIMSKRETFHNPDIGRVYRTICIAYGLGVNDKLPELLYQACEKAAYIMNKSTIRTMEA